MSYKIVLGLLLMSLCVLGHGCTYQAWHAGLQERQRQECYRLVSSDETQKCLDSANSRTYDEYKAQREEATGTTK